MSFSRRTFFKAGGSAALLAATGCERAQKQLLSLYPFAHPKTGPFTPPAATSVDPVAHALNRLTFGAQPGDYARVRALDRDPAVAAAAFLNAQLSPAQIDDSDTEHRVRRFDMLEEPAAEMFEYKERRLLDWMERATILRAIHSDRQLFEVMVQFWSDHFNIDPSKGDCRWLKAADDREVIRRHALGNFTELLRASALSPAMLWYLDGAVNRRRNPEDRPNENYARELLELHTLGVHGGYTQHDVMEVARCLTGWTVRGKKQFSKGRVEFHPDSHDYGAKEFLGRHIPAVTPGLSADERRKKGESELDWVLEAVALHPATARHLAEKMCRRFIADEPPRAAVETVAQAFLASSGDIPATLRALFGTEEFLAARGNKFKRPFNFLVSALRATGASVSEKHRLNEFLLRMGHAPFHYPTPDGYPEEAGHWMGTLLWRWNFATALVENKLPGVSIDLPELEKSCGGPSGLMAHLLGRQPTADEAAACRESGAGPTLLLASPAFQLC